MEMLRKIALKHYVLVLLLGLVVANYTFQPISIQDGTTEEINTEHEQETDETLFKASEAIQSNTSFSLSYHSFLVKVVVYASDPVIHGIVDDQLSHYELKTYRILLSRIISPNAP